MGDCDSPENYSCFGIINFHVYVGKVIGSVSASLFSIATTPITVPTTPLLLLLLIVAIMAELMVINRIQHAFRGNP